MNHLNKGSYDDLGRLNINFENESDFNLNPIIECGDECKCDDDCLNRVVQTGTKFDLEVFKCNNQEKGYGLRAKEKIPVGSFVIEYKGEILGIEDGERLYKERCEKNEPNYIMILKENYLKDNSSQVTVIDAKNYSNKARFINHGCDPNLIVIPARVNNIIPHAALFAIRCINEMEELCYDYNGSLGNFQDQNIISHNLTSSIKCFCKAQNCRGFLSSNLK